ncbi:hypothetical protein [Streptosporangium sandarakinum]|uniref:Uncharacterized protein n=1 Tax=Streptosporangium sandarakinum TaxID=1260955 RepID=A0A852UTB6_9ACTN|nr:hypothetical protein [Streptosporangium sandarakinum]NYF40472.1 hypothetical protein [Streptosporangium sandarakinum]
MSDIAEEIIKVFYPDPAPWPQEKREHFVQRRSEASRRRDEMRKRLTGPAGAPKDSSDLLISELRRLGRAKREVEEQMRLLVTYGREFIRPEPYRLASLAEAAGMSISGVRGMYGLVDIQRVADAIGRPDRKRQVSPVDPSDALPDAGFDAYGRLAPIYPSLYPSAKEEKTVDPREAPKVSDQRQP